MLFKDGKLDVNQQLCLIHMIPINIVDGKLCTVDVSDAKVKTHLTKPLPRHKKALV